MRLLDTLDYHPFGATHSYRLTAVTGTPTISRHHDSDGRIDCYTLGDTVKTLSYDRLGNLKTHSDENGANTQNYSYDASQQLRWRWDHQDPFGANAPDSNPQNLGNFTYNLRFPGQYYDQKTGLFYNAFRDYDPATGRYVCWLPTQVSEALVLRTTGSKSFPYCVPKPELGNELKAR